MLLREAVERAANGDVQAFEELVRCYQNTAFVYAFSLLHDFHLAQDATQEAFISAFFGLEKLRDKDKFPSWLRGIVRYQCLRLLRRRDTAAYPLDADAPTILDSEQPAELVEQREHMRTVVDAIRAQPEELREVALLYFIQDQSQRQVAAFLDLSVTTVNNRLHAARKVLRGVLASMARDTINQHGLPDSFAHRIGTIVSTQGPLLEARFEPEHVPTLLSALSGITGGAVPDDTLAGVVQYVGNGTVRCIALPAQRPLQAGERLAMAERPVEGSLDSMN